MQPTLAVSSTREVTHEDPTPGTQAVAAFDANLETQTSVLVGQLGPVHGLSATLPIRFSHSVPAIVLHLDHQKRRGAKRNEETQTSVALPDADLTKQTAKPAEKSGLEKDRKSGHGALRDLLWSLEPALLAGHLPLELQAPASDDGRAVHRVVNPIGSLVLKTDPRSRAAGYSAQHYALGESKFIHSLHLIYPSHAKRPNMIVALLEPGVDAPPSRLIGEVLTEVLLHFTAITKPRHRTGKGSAAKRLSAILAGDVPSLRRFKRLTCKTWAKAFQTLAASDPRHAAALETISHMPLRDTAVHAPNSVGLGSDQHVYSEQTVVSGINFRHDGDRLNFSESPTHQTLLRGVTIYRCTTISPVKTEAKLDATCRELFERRSFCERIRATLAGIREGFAELPILTLAHLRASAVEHLAGIDLRGLLGKHAKLTHDHFHLPDAEEKLFRIAKAWFQRCDGIKIRRRHTLGEAAPSKLPFEPGAIHLRSLLLLCEAPDEVGPTKKNYRRPLSAADKDFCPWLGFMRRFKQAASQLDAVLGIIDGVFAHCAP